MFFSRAGKVLTLGGILCGTLAYIRKPSEFSPEQKQQAKIKAYILKRYFSEVAYQQDRYGDSISRVMLDSSYRQWCQENPRLYRKAIESVTQEKETIFSTGNQSTVRK